MRAARYLGVPVWDLERVPILWRERALVAERVEAEVAREQEKRAMERARRRGH